MKERLRAEDAVYGGEMSAHHYFRDFAYCDSGMLPWLLVLGLVQRTGRPLAELVAERMALYPCSGEINRGWRTPRPLMRRVPGALCGAGRPRGPHRRREPGISPVALQPAQVQY